MKVKTLVPEKMGSQLQGGDYTGNNPGVRQSGRSLGGQFQVGKLVSSQPLC